MGDMDFAKRMSLAPDEELLTVVSSDKYVPAAVAAAQAEIERRNIGSDDVARMSANIDELRKLDENKPSIPLSRAGKIAFFVFSPLLIWSILAVLVLAFRGYGQKSFDAIKCIGMGLLFWLIVGIALLLIAG